MNKASLIVVPVLLLFIGCDTIGRVQMERKTGRDAVIMVQRYKEASVSEVEAVLNEYLVLADDYEKRGWAKYGSDGWIEHLRAMCEGRLAVFYKATGRADLYRQHLDSAIAHLKKKRPGGEVTEGQVIALIEGLDSKNIDPNWRKEIGKQSAGANSHQPPAGARSSP